MANITQHETFTKLIEEHKGIIYKVANSYCQNKEYRNDLVQEILLQLWRSFEKYSDQFKISTWMYRISLNVAISYYRKEATENKHLPTVNKNILEISDDIVSDEAVSNVKQLYRFIGKLKDLDKAITLLYLDGENHKDIANSLGMTETNVATKIGRIKQKLKQQFSTMEKL